MNAMNNNPSQELSDRWSADSSADRSWRTTETTLNATIRAILMAVFHPPTPGLAF